MARGKSLQGIHAWEAKIDLLNDHAAKAILLYYTFHTHGDGDVDESLAEPMSPYLLD
jgi:hypothetical protein